MNTTKNETVSLRDGKITITVPVADAALVSTFDKMEPGLKVALIQCAIDNFKYRAGAKAGNDGKTFSLEEIAKAVAGTGSRTGEAKPVDVAAAKALMTKLWAGATGKDNKEKVKAATAALEKAATGAVTKYGLMGAAVPTYDEKSIATFCREIRLAKARMAREAVEF